MNEIGIATSNDNNKSMTLQDVVTLVRQGEMAKAADILHAFIQSQFNLELSDNAVTIRKDTISLNSVNGFIKAQDSTIYFFKFHLEEDESDTVSEYYNAALLEKAGYPVEKPLCASTTPGEQILIYPYVEHERLFDACLRNENLNTDEANDLAAAQADLDRLCFEKTKQTLHVGSQQDYQSLSLLQLFYWRLVDANTPNKLGGRHARFYKDQTFEFPNGLKLHYDVLSNLKWNINGVSYDKTFEQSFTEARNILSPAAIDSYAACTAHGDAHNGNVWFCSDKDTPSLSYFDPAFAGDKIPVLLAEIKTTFHNIFAHPLWLYDAQGADANLMVKAKTEGGVLYVEHDWTLTKLREEFISSKIEHFWKPALRLLQDEKLLPDHWEDIIRAALFCCPTLVMNLRANADKNQSAAQNIHTPKTSLLGLSIAMMCAAKPVNEQDLISDFIQRIDPNQKP